MAVTTNPKDQMAFVTIKPSDSYQWGSHLYLRDEIIDLFDEFEKLRKHRGDRIRYLHIYCDKLIYSSAIEDDGTLCLEVALGPNVELRYVHVFARDFLASVPKLKVIRVKHASPVDLLLVYEQAPSFLRIISKVNGPVTQVAGCEILQNARLCPSAITATSGTGSTEKKCGFTHHLPNLIDAGWVINIGNEKVQANSLPDVPVQEVDPVSADEMEAFGPQIVRTDNLTHLLQKTFNSAATSITDSTQPYELIVSKLRFVERCSKGSVAQVNLAVNAKALLDRLELPRSVEDGTKTSASDFVAELFVPKLDFSTYLTSMTTRTKITTKLEEQIDDSSLHNRLVEVANSNLDVMFAGFSITNEETEGDISTYEDTARAAIEHLHKSQSEMAKYEDEVATASNKFKAMLGEYAANKEMKMIIEAVSAGVSLIVGVVTTVATCGAGAPATIGTTMAILNKTYQAGSKLKEALVAIAKIGKIVWDLSQKLKVAYQSQSSYSFLGATKGSKTLSDTKALDNLTQGAKNITTKSLPAPATEVIDYIGLGCDWEEFKLNTESAFEKLELAFKDDTDAEKVVEALIDFRTKLKAQALRGQALLAATREAQDTQQYFYRRLTEKKAREERRAKLDALGKRIADKKTRDTTAWPIYRALLQRDLNTAKQSLFVMLHRGLLSIMYGLGVGSFPEKFKNESGVISFGPEILAQDLEHRFLELQEIYNGRGKPTKFDIRVGSSDDEGAVFDESWRTTIKHRVAPFTIPPTLANCQERIRTRIRSINATFHGLTTLPSSTKKMIPSIPYSVVVGPSMIDRIDNGLIKYWKPADYVLQDVEPLSELYFTSPTLFSEGYIFFLESEIKDWDLSSITDISLNIACFGTPKGGLQKMGEITKSAKSTKV